MQMETKSDADVADDLGRQGNICDDVQSRWRKSVNMT